MMNGSWNGKTQAWVIRHVNSGRSGLTIHRSQFIKSVNARSRFDPSEPHDRGVHGGRPSELLGCRDVQHWEADRTHDRYRWPLTADGVVGAMFGPQEGSQRLRKASSDDKDIADEAEQTNLIGTRASARRKARRERGMIGHQDAGGDPLWPQRCLTDGQLVITRGRARTRPRVDGRGSAPGRVGLA